MTPLDIIPAEYLVCLLAVLWFTLDAAFTVLEILRGGKRG